MKPEAHDEPIDEEYRARVLAAYRDLCDREGVRLLKDAEIARRMVEFDRSLRTGYQQAGRLLDGTRSRHRPTMIAFAHALGVDPGWLDYGPASDAPAPAFAKLPATIGMTEQVIAAEAASKRLAKKAALGVPKIEPKPIEHAGQSHHRHAARKGGRRRSS